MVKLAWIDQLVLSGLAPKKKLPYARIVLADVPQGITSMVYRGLAIEMFSKITNLILNDQVLYQRLRQLLVQRQHEELEEVARFVGTKSYLDLAKSVTPGQQAPSKTLKTIKKVVVKE